MYKSIAPVHLYIVVCARVCVCVCVLCTAGCHVIAPSDMMDNRIAAIKRGLLEAGLGGKVCIYI